MTRNPSRSKPGVARFIAGAICPECRALDRIQVTGSGDDAIRACVACGFEEKVRGVPTDPIAGKFDSQLGRRGRNRLEPVVEKPVKILPKS